MIEIILITITTSFIIAVYWAGYVNGKTTAKKEYLKINAEQAKNSRKRVQKSKNTSRSNAIDWLSKQADG